MAQLLNQKGLFDELKFAVGKLGEMIKPPEGKTRQQVWDEYMKDGGKSEAIKEVNRFANRTMDSALLHAPSAAMKSKRTRCSGLAKST